MPRASFRPERRIAALRDHLRQRERLLSHAPSHIQRMHMNLRLHVTRRRVLNHIVSDITGATGLRFIRAVVAGERDPAALAALHRIVGVDPIRIHHVNT